MTISQEKLQEIAEAQGVTVAELPVGAVIESGEVFEQAEESAKVALSSGQLDTPVEVIGLVDKHIVDAVDDTMTVFGHILVVKEVETGYLAIADQRGYANISTDQAKSLITLLEKALKTA